MKAAPCTICKRGLGERTKNFPFCSERCKLVDVGNWLDGAYRVEPDRDSVQWGENR
ncbi:MAG: DNA gyrase inhibitor YacG [Polyangiales bacterium]